MSPDEEHVTLRASWQTGELNLGARAHHYTLLTLARLRLRDRDAGAPGGEEGWVYAQDLQRMLAVDAGKLNLDVFRARKQLARYGVLDAARLVERRPDTRQLRLGVERLSVHSTA